MDTAPVVMMSARSIPQEIEERYQIWYNTAYGPIYLRTPGIRGIDRYKLIWKNFSLPGEINIYHGDNFETLKRVYSNPASDRNAAVRDALSSFSLIARFWINIYELIGSFRNSPPSQGLIDTTLVDNAAIMHIEGYKIPDSDKNKFEGWFNKWASRVYIPPLLRIPGVKACNFYTLVDFNDPAYTSVRFIETELPKYLSFTYFDNNESLERFDQSLECAAFRGSLELGFPDNLKIVWNTEYQLFASHRPTASTQTKS